MKARKTSAPRRKAGGGMLIGLFVGLVIGVLVAAGVVWYIHRTPMPFNTKVQTPPPAPPPAQTAGAQPQAPIPLPGKPGDPVPAQSDKPRFYFYKILPGNAEGVPDPKSTETKSADAKTKTEKEEAWMSEFSGFLEMAYRIAYVMITEYDPGFKSYEDWLKGIDNVFNNENWILEVMECAMSTFRR